MKMFPVSRRRRAMVGAGLSLPILPGIGLAQTEAKAPPALRDFFRLPALTGLAYSPDGKFIAGLRDVGGRSNITVVDLSTRRALIVTQFKDSDVARVRWVNNQRLLFSMIDRQGGRGARLAGGLLAINRDASDFRQLAERRFITEGERLLPPSTTFEARVREKGEFTDDVIVSVYSMMGYGRFTSNLYRLNTVTGRSSLISLGGPPDSIEWVVDRNNVVRASVSIRDDMIRVHLRDNEQSPWRMIFEFRDREVNKSVSPVAFDKAGRLYVSAYAGNDNAAIYRYDNAAGRLEAEPIAAVKGFDLSGGLRFDADGERLLGIDYNADREGTYWIDPEVAKQQAQIDKALPNHVNQLQFREVSGPAAAPTLVVSYSDRNPGRYYLFNPERGTLESISQSRPWIEPDRMRPARFYRYTARDGMSIPAQLTLPEGQGKFPLVVLHYGGPWVRPFDWEWDGTVQFLASRGYAVLMPAPRASTGFGAKLYQSGWKQWGLAMQDDVTDGVQDLIKQGVVDPKRVALMGASYGGYLTMMGLAKEPDLFKCGINWVGVTDLTLLLTVAWSDVNMLGGDAYGYPLTVGDPEKDAAQFKRTSPVERAAEIKQPVLMAYGAQDRRVPLIHGEKMRDALKPHNPKVEWIVYPEEAHGWRLEQNRLDFFARVEKFLAENL
jgi:dipeptidyl aminopeptidase/acylaminoacyl peptidase